MARGERPTHRIAVVREGGGIWHPIGVAWYDSGKNRFTLKLNPFVDLSRINERDNVMAFPIDEKPIDKPGYKRNGSSYHYTDNPGDYGDDDIPF